MKTLPKKNLRRAVFFDRDGVLNKKPLEHDYVKSHEEFFWNKGAMELVKKINDLGFLAVVISNQRGIARGMVTAAFVEDLHLRMNAELAEVDARIDAFYYCPHGNDDKCACRKPLHGLFLKAAEEWGIDLENSFAVGDSDVDDEAAVRAACVPIRIPVDVLSVDGIVTVLAGK